MATGRGERDCRNDRVGGVAGSAMSRRPGRASTGREPALTLLRDVSTPILAAMRPPVEVCALLRKGCNSWVVRGH